MPDTLPQHLRDLLKENSLFPLHEKDAKSVSSFAKRFLKKIERMSERVSQADR
jgi:hypothetical protein